MRTHQHTWLARVVSTVVAVSVVLLVPFKAIAVTAQLMLYTTPGAVSVVAGDSFSLQVRLSNTTNSKVDHVSADMRFPSSMVEVTTIDKSGSHFTSGGGPAVSYNNTNGTVSIIGSGTLLGNPADVLVATIYFHAKTAGTGNVIFASGSQAGDLTGANNVKNYLTSTSASSVSVSNPSAPSQTEPTVPSGPVSEQPGAPSQSTPSSDTSSAPPADMPAALPGDQSLESQTPTVGQEGSRQGGGSFWRMLGMGVGTLVLAAACALLFVFRPWLRRSPADRAKEKTAPIVSPNNKEHLAAITAQTDDDDSVAVGPLDPAVSSPASPVPELHKVPAVSAERPVPLQSRPEVKRETSVPNPVRHAAPAVHRPIPVQPEPPVPHVSNAPAATRAATPHADAEPPDMFEVGAARLKAEGLGDEVRSSSR